MPTRRRVLAELGAGMAVMVGMAGCSTDYLAGETTRPTGQSTDWQNTTGPNTSGPGDSPYVRVYRQVSPSVAQVQVTASGGAGLGSATIYDDRHLVTNQHVVQNGTEVSVVYPGGNYTTASVKGADAYSDLAVLGVEGHPDGAAPLEFATGDPPIGTEVVVIGAPFGLEGSISEGVVSGIDRSLPAPNDFRIPDAIQTDAAANPGNSGGPLVALDGTPIGIVNSGAGNNITFAISGALAARVVPALIERGSYDHAYMGVAIRNLSPALARANNHPTLRGVYVHRVLQDGPATGVLQGSDGSTRALGRRVPTGGDVIVALDGNSTHDSGQLGTHLALQKAPGDTVRVTVVRDGSRETVRMELGTRPPPS